MQTSPKKLLACSVFAVLALALPASAHHSTTMFNHASVVAISGVVKEVHWTNPHVAIFVMGAAKPDETPAMWVLEMTSPGNLTRSGGWSRTAIKPGDKVDVTMAPLRNGDKGGALKKITVAERNLTLNADIRDAEGVIKE
ncbi:MAG: hypothetical protein JWN94_1315 [Betaproteobacteria bacterium]|nr:hypothetical protein [Betaproteobacteria bacterium]